MNSFTFPTNASDIIAKQREYQSLIQTFEMRFMGEAGDYDRESLFMQRSPRKEVTESELEVFRHHLMIQPKQHTEYHQWITHLRNWIATYKPKNETGTKKPFWRS